ncbi:MAG: phage holin family protein [Nibricoccus sp.]
MNNSVETAPLPGLGRLQSSAAVLARGLDHRAELASLELEEARDHANGLFGLFLLGAIAALLTGFALNFFVAALWWDTPHRLLSLGLLAVVQGAVAAAALITALRRSRKWHPLAQTFAQLKKDSQCIRELLHSPHQ